MNKEKEMASDNIEAMTSQEQKILEVIRNMDFGEVRVVITDGKPIRIEEIKKSIKL